MEVLNDINKPKPKKKKTPHRSSLSSISLLSLLFFLFFFLSYKIIPKSITYPVSRKTLIVKFPQCGRQILGGERFLWYAPHSGFSNQLSEFKNAILMAGILNRTLIVPPILDHHAVALGSCPKFRVLSPNEIRVLVWDHTVELIRNRRYISMAEIIDISALVSSSSIKTIDFRVFVSQWCGANTNFACFNESDSYSNSFDSLNQCRSLMSGLEGNVNNCIYPVQEDCRTTVWTYNQNHENGVLDSFQPDKKILKKQKSLYIRKRRDVYKTLGPGSESEFATVLAFGSLFTATYKESQLYIDIQDTPGDPRIQSLIKKIEFLPFNSEIITAGKKFSFENIKSPFLCSQLRLLDGQFKNHWKTTFLALQEKVETLLKKGPRPIHIFLMTDLPEANWTDNYLGGLSRDLDSFKLHILKDNDEILMQISNRVMTSEKTMNCTTKISPDDMLLYVEETICSCASLGFVGTVGSTIAESIELMRKHGICSNENQTSP